jgi:pyridoxine/pyridoxamine 5'-phosphate oxidase
LTQELRTEEDKMTANEPVATQPLLADKTPTSWAEARQHLGGGDTYWLTTVHPDGRPHLRPVLAVWVDGGLHFCAGPATAKGRNLARDPRCVLAIGDEAADLVVEGHAAKVGDDAKLQQVAEVYAAKYDWQVEVRAVRPTTVFAFGTDESFSPTRWTFEATP